MNEDTIAAIATPGGVGAISIIRISGSEAINLADSIFTGKSKLSEAKSHTIHYGKIFSDSEGKIDDALVSVFRAPNSYTGEDSIELNVHGSPFIASHIMSLLVERGIRLAEPGEFTKRAFINNKLDLVQAEAVADVIRASTETSLRGARNQLDGILSQKVSELRNLLLNLSSYVELELDFSEEDIRFIERDKLISGIIGLLDELNALSETYSYGRIIRDGINIAIVGQPNVGKSSLLNYMLKESRAIVSHLPGTTRDIIREEVSVEGILVKIFDTAGIRHSIDEIEKEGIQRSRNAIKNADIVIFLGDVEQGFSEELFEEIRRQNRSANVLKILNKIDLVINSSISCDVKISAKTGFGISDLFDKIKYYAYGSSTYSEKTAVITNIRHYNCIKQATNHLQNAKKSTETKMSGEFISVDLRLAEQSLEEILGTITSDDILNNIFSQFCIGK